MGCMFPVPIRLDFVVCQLIDGIACLRAAAVEEMDSKKGGSNLFPVSLPSAPDLDR